MEFNAYGIAIVPLIIVLVALAVRLGLNRKYAPVAALALGVAAGFIYLAPGEPKKAILYGIVAGLSAVGLYSGVKNVGQGLTESAEEDAGG